MTNKKNICTKTTNNYRGSDDRQVEKWSFWQHIIHADPLFKGQTN